MKNSILKKLQISLKHPLLIKKKENLFYLTGRSFNNSADEYLLVTKREAVGFGSGLEHIGWIKKVDRLKNIGQYLHTSHSIDIEFGETFGDREYFKAKLSCHSFLNLPH